MPSILPHHQLTQQHTEGLREFAVCRERDFFLWQQLMRSLVAGAQALAVFEARIRNDLPLLIAMIQAVVFMTWFQDLDLSFRGSSHMEPVSDRKHPACKTAMGKSPSRASAVY